jgi:formate hydrogenlyase subunit 6/NADH:ubiquinone oxidoreductase subunit I
MSYKITEICNGCVSCVRLCPVKAISGEKKKVHVIDPNLCIDCGACGRICPKGSVLNAQNKPCLKTPKLWMWPRPIVDFKNCVSCRACVEGCPTQCMDMNVDVGDKHPRPGLKEPKRCISCGFCAEECPVDAIIMATPTVRREMQILSPNKVWADK